MEALVLELHVVLVAVFEVLMKIAEILLEGLLVFIRVV